MKKFFIYLGCFVSGIIFTVIISMFANNNSGLVMFEEEGKCFHTNKLEVFQSLEPGAVLAELSNGNIVLFLDKNKKSYYDGETISVSKDKCARQVGTYQYETHSKMMKTVPVVMIK